MKIGPIVIWLLVLIFVIAIPLCRYLVLPHANTVEQLTAKVSRAASATYARDTAFMRDQPLADRVDIEGWLQARGMMQQPLVTDSEVLAVIRAAMNYFSETNLDEPPIYVIPIRADQGRIRTQRVWMLQYCRGIRRADATWKFLPQKPGMVVIEARYPYKTFGESSSSTPRLAR